MTCVRRTESRGRNSHTHEKILWQEERIVSKDQVFAGYQGSSIPVEFSVPFDAEPADKSDAYDQVLWRLDVKGDVSGVDYATQFDVPVFRTEKSSAEPPVEESMWGPKDPGSEFDPRLATVVVRPSALGGTEFYFPPARNKGAAISTTAFLMIWMGSVWLQVQFHAPLFFPVVSGLIGVVIFFVALGLWFSTTRVVIEAGKIRVVKRTLCLGSTKTLRCSDANEIKLGIGMQQRQTMTQSARAYYDIEIHPKAGWRIKAGGQLRDKREAKWLAAEMAGRVEASS